METREWFELSAFLVVRQIPILVVASIGLWFAVTRRASLGRVAKWAVWGFGLLIAYAAVSVVLQLAITFIQISLLRGGDRSESFIRVSMWALAAHPVLIGGLAVLARAVFLDRRAA